MEDIVAGLIDWFVHFMVKIAGCDAKDLTIELTGQVKNVFDIIWGMVAPFAITLTTVYFGVDLNKKMVFEGTDVTLKTFGFPFIKLAAAYVVISNGEAIFKALTDITNAFITMAGEAGGGDKWNSDIGKQIAEALGFWGLIIVVLPLLIGLVVGFIVKLVWVYKGFTFKCEYIARYAFGPIALADIYSGANTAAIRYIKGTLAFGLYGVCLIVLPKLVNAVAVNGLETRLTELINKGVNSFGDVLGIIVLMLEVMVAPIAALGVVGASKQITREAMGA